MVEETSIPAPHRNVRSCPRSHWLAILVTGIILQFCGAFAHAAEVPVATLIKRGNLDEAERQLINTLTRDPRNATALTLLGQVRLQQRKYRSAESLFSQAVLANPKSSLALEQLGSLYTEEKRNGEAIAIYESLLKIQPQKASTRVALATLYEQEGKPREALRLAKTLPEVSRPEGLLPVVAVCYALLNQPDDAQRVIGQILRRAPISPELVPSLAMKFIQHGMSGDAAELLRIASGHQKHTSSFLIATAAVQGSSGRVQQAQETIAQVLDDDPRHLEALIIKARLDANERNWSAEVETLKSASKIGPPRIDILRNLIFATMQTDDLQAAHDAALDLYELAPDNPDSALSLVAVLIRGGHWGEAKPILEKLLAASPNDKRSSLAMGIVQYNLGNIDQAERLLTNSLGDKAVDPEAHYMLGLVAKQRGDIPGAASQMEQCLAVNPTKAEALSSLGQLYVQLNEPAKARTLLEKAIAQSPDDPQNHYQLGLAYRKLGLSDQAREQLALFQKLSQRHVPQPVGESAGGPPK